VADETTTPLRDQRLPTVDAERVTRIFNQLSRMEIALDSDPLIFGPKRLQAKVAGARDLLTRCERIFLQVSHDLAVFKTTHRQASTDLDLQMQDLLANDIEVRAGRNVRDREAVANTKLRAEREIMLNLEMGIQDLEMVMTVVKAKRADLKDVQGRIRDQLKLCQEEISLGRRWGSRPAPGEPNIPTLDNVPDVNLDTEALAGLSDVEGEIHLPHAQDDEDDEDQEDEPEEEGLAAVEEDLLDDLVGDEPLTEPEIELLEPEPKVVVKNLTDQAIAVVGTKEVIEPEPAPEEVEEEVEEVPLPEPAEANHTEAHGLADQDIDSLLDSIDAETPSAKPVKASAKKKAKEQPAMKAEFDELDLEDLIGSFGS